MVRQNKKGSNPLLSFDESSPLFAPAKKCRKCKQKTTDEPCIPEAGLTAASADEKPKRKRRTKAQIAADNAPPSVSVEDTTEATPRTRRAAKSASKKNPLAPTYEIRSPSDCRHLLKGKWEDELLEEWALLLESGGSGKQASSMNSLLRGSGQVAKVTNPKEYQEILVLLQLVKEIEYGK